MPERPITFTSGSHHLVGILHEPIAAATPRRGVLFFSPGVQAAKAGPARSYVRLARSLASSGWCAFRFDFPGLGESEGELPPSFQVDEFSPEVTRAVTTAAVQTFCREAHIDEVVFYGLCGGARTALNAAGVDGRVTGLVLLGLPLMRSGEVGWPAPEKLDVRGYLRKARQWVYWKRFLTLQSDYQFFRKALWHLVRGRLAERSRVDSGVAHNLLETLKRGQRLLFLYGDRDPFYKAFQVGLQPQLSRLNGSAPVDYACRIIPAASHAFPQAAAQERLIEEMLAWLAARYPAQSPVRVG